MKVRRSKLDRVNNVLCLLMLSGTVIFLMLYWDKIPDMIPGHYNFAGEIDSMSGKGSLIGLIAVGWGLFLGITLIEKFPQAWNTGVQVTEENKERVYRTLKNFIEAIKFLVVLLFSYMTLCSVNGDALSPYFTPGMLIVWIGLFIVFLYRLVKVK